METILERVKKEIKQLTAEEKTQVRDLLNQVLLPDEIDRQLQERLYAEGFLTEIKPPRNTQTGRDYQLIEVKGEPVSETIIKERR